MSYANRTPLRGPRAPAWTPADEKLFQELIARREPALAQRHEDLRKSLTPAADLVVALFSRAPSVPMPGHEALPLGTQVMNAIVNGVLGNVDNLCDALQPFDSGTRCTPEPVTSLSPGGGPLPMGSSFVRHPND